MQEDALAKTILAQALARAAVMGAVKIRTVRGWVSETQPLSAEKIQAHFRSYAKGTLAENTNLKFDTKRVQVRCLSCDRISEPMYSTHFCSFCGSERLEHTERAGVVLDNLEVD